MWDYYQPNRSVTFKPIFKANSRVLGGKMYFPCQQWSIPIPFSARLNLVGLLNGNVPLKIIFQTNSRVQFKKIYFACGK